MFFWLTLYGLTVKAEVTYMLSPLCHYLTLGPTDLSTSRYRPVARVSNTSSTVFQHVSSDKLEKSG